jgi:Xaa-Pro aminopeptidase
VIAEAGAGFYTVSLDTSGGSGPRFGGFRGLRRFEAGETARVDLVLVYEGYYCDFGRSWVVGGRERSPGGAALVDVLRAALDAAVAAARPGAVSGEIARAGLAALPADVETAYPPHWGHGLGMGWEGPFLVADGEEPIEEGFALAVEVALHRDGIVVSGEHDVLVGADGPEILTAAGWP